MGYQVCEKICGVQVERRGKLYLQVVGRRFLPRLLSFVRSLFPCVRPKSFVLTSIHHNQVLVCLGLPDLRSWKLRRVHVSLVVRWAIVLALMGSF